MKKSETQQIMNEPYQVFLPEELHKEILNSKTIKVYNSFQKLNYTTYIKWFMFFGFTIGAISLMINDTPPLWVKIVMGCIFIPSAIYGLIGGVIHYLFGRKVRQWAKKYNLSFYFITNEISIIYKQINNE
jgi:hypothetical protein